MCSSKPPKADPLVGQSAMANAEISKEMAGVARDTLAWNKDRAAQQDPLIEKVVQQQIDSADTNAARAESQWNIYKNLFAPIEEKMVDDANNWDSPERQERMASQAAGDVRKSYQGALDSNQRGMERMGINPNSGRFQAIQNETNLGLARDAAGAMNGARRATEQQGVALRTGAAQFGRNMPNTGIAADSLALNGGNSAVGNMAAGANINNAGTNAAVNWFGGAQAGNNSAGGLMNNLYGNQLNAWSQDQQMKAQSMAGIGSLLGTAGGAAAMMLRKGGVIKNNSAHGLSGKPLSRPNASSGGLGMLRRSGYAEGGMIEGPGTGTSDSIPASIEGVQPIRLSNGEAVLNKEAVGLIGEDAVHRLNAGGLMMLEKSKGRAAGRGAGGSRGGLSMLAKH
ncbi:hypothetical protein SAMN05216428_102396 [Nitrosospira sp. Nsp11]|uniref:hypothetical protein n=1 Tax=Nitrosospira sp. Nsp11 TaxID=1855338 RepID=UPI00091BF2B5|nr:hypothetical protein [Nitrosospira sp. Nsp11]SHL43435.1 hypothetical protein SAMN05216428_102396 [Nitrosospira sp. Nsp11]